MNELQQEIIRMTSVKALTPSQIYHILEMAGKERSYYHISKVMKLMADSFYLLPKKRGKYTYYRATTEGLRATTTIKHLNLHRL